MPDRSGQLEVVVLGASIAGSAAAAGLAGPGRRVLLLERDVLPTRPEVRRGVPQGAQPHVFLLRGLREAEGLLPGLAARLRERGAVPLDTGQLPYLTEWGWFPPGRSIEILSLSRPLLESEVRAAALARPGVRLRDGATVTGLRRDGGCWRVALADGEEIGADVVVDATGRSSRLPLWLERAGCPPPETDVIDAQVGYASRLFAGVVPGLPGVAIPMTPRTRRGGYLLPLEGDRWLITAMGCGERRPPRDLPGWTAALEALPDPVLAGLARRLEPLSDVAVHRQTENRRAHYEKVLPPGLLVVGDALATFNPVYGQGITVAVLQGRVLQAAAKAQLHGRAPLRRLQRHLGRCTRTPWLVAAGADAAYPTSTGDPSTAQRLAYAWGRRLQQAGVRGDTQAVTAVSEVYHLIAPPTALLRPRVVVAGLRPRRSSIAAPRPEVLAVAG